jgi:hypothetical protein
MIISTDINRPLIIRVVFTLVINRDVFGHNTFEIRALYAILQVNASGLQADHCWRHELAPYKYCLIQFKTGTHFTWRFVL